MATTKKCVPEYLDVQDNYGREKQTKEGKVILSSANTIDYGSDIKAKRNASVFALNKIKGSTKSAINQIFNSESYYDLKDPLKEFTDEEKIQHSISEVNRKFTDAYAAARTSNGSVARLRDYSTFKLAMFMLDNNRPLTKIPGYKELSATRNLSKSEFRKIVKENYDIAKKRIVEDPNAMAAIKRSNGVKKHYMEEVNKAAKEQVFELEKFNVQDINGGYEFMASQFIMQENNSDYRKMVEQRLNIKYEDILNDPKLMDIILTHTLDMAAKTYTFMNVVNEKYNVSKEFYDEAKSSLEEYDELSFENIQARPTGDKLKSTLNQLLDFVGDEQTIRTSASGEKYNDVMATLIEGSKVMAAAIEKGYSELSSNKRLMQKIEQSKDTSFKNTYKLLEGQSYDINGLIKETDNLLFNDSPEFSLHSFETYQEAKAKVDMFKEAIEAEQFTTKENFTKKISEKYPDHVIISKNGTKFVGKNGQPVELTEADFIPGSISGILMPDKISEDIMTAGIASWFGEDFVNNSFKKKGWLVVHKDVAEAIFEAKKPAVPEDVKNGAIAQISQAFRKHAILSPFRFAKYATTGYLGNIYWTTISNPKAFSYWPVAKEVLKSYNAKDGSFERDYENSDYGKILKEIIAHGGGYAEFHMSEVGLPEDQETLLGKAQDVQQNVWDKSVRWAGEKAMDRENWHRFALAIAHFEDMKSGNFNKASLIGANQERVMSIEDIHKRAAVLSHEQMIDYSDISKFGKRANATVMMFWTYTEGMMKNHYRLFTGVYKNLKEGIETGNTEQRNTALKKMGMSVFVMGGVMSLTWNLVMKSLGLINEDDYEDMKKATEDKGMRRLLKNFGLPGDGFVYLPGTGIEGVDKFAGIGIKRDSKGNALPSSGATKFNASDGLAEMIPFLSGKGIIDTVGGKVVSSLNPVFKAPIELMTGTTYSPDFGVYKDPNWDTMSAGQRLVEKGASFFGADEVARDFFDTLHGEANAPRSSQSRELQTYLSEIEDYDQASFDPNRQQYKYEIINGMQSLDPEYTNNAINDYVTYLERYNSEKPDDQVDIRNEVMNVIRRNNIFTAGTPEARQSIMVNPEYQGRLDQVINTQIQFLNAIGINIEDL